MDKFREKYRISSARLQNWDYGSNGAYFITICSKNKEHFFGSIINNVMHLNPQGRLAEELWLDIPNHFPYIELENFVVMPNHMHGILIIDKSRLSMDECYSDSFTSPKYAITNCRDAINRVSTISNHIFTNNNNIGGFSGIKNPMLNANISRIVRWYKGRCTYEIRKTNYSFAWQSRFHDHIIRNTESFEHIQSYIHNNPANWKDDKFYS